MPWGTATETSQKMYFPPLKSVERLRAEDTDLSQGKIVMYFNV
jgi:hypothetical protein